MERGRGSIHVLGDRAHLRLTKHPGDVEITRLVQEVRHLLEIVVGPERPPQIERIASSIDERDRSRRVQRPRVERATQHEPPVEEIGEPARRHIESPAGEQCHRRGLIVDEVVELISCQSQPRRPLDDAGASLHAAIGRDQ